MHVEIQAAIVLLLAAHSSAIDTVSIAQTVQAGTDVPVSITTDFGQGRYSVDAQWEHYRLYLSEDKVHYKLTPMCFLSPILDWNTTSTTVNIPPNVGPNASSYRIYAGEYNGTFSPDSAGSFQWSDRFALEGSTLKEWAPGEHILAGYRTYDEIPCTAYDCNRKCWESTDGKKTIGPFDGLDYCRCLKACPGVVTENPFYGANDGCGWQWRYMASESASPSSSEISSPVASITSSSSISATSTSVASSLIMTPTTGVAATAQQSAPTSTSLASPVGITSHWYLAAAILVPLFAAYT